MRAACGSGNPIFSQRGRKKGRLDYSIRHTEGILAERVGLNPSEEA